MGRADTTSSFSMSPIVRTPEPVRGLHSSHDKSGTQCTDARHNVKYRKDRVNEQLKRTFCSKAGGASCTFPLKPEDGNCADCFVLASKPYKQSNEQVGADREENNERAAVLDETEKGHLTEKDSLIKTRERDMEDGIVRESKPEKEPDVRQILGESLEKPAEEASDDKRDEANSKADQDKEIGKTDVEDGGPLKATEEQDGGPLIETKEQDGGPLIAWEEQAGTKTAEKADAKQHRGKKNSAKRRKRTRKPNQGVDRVKSWQKKAQKALSITEPPKMKKVANGSGGKGEAKTGGQPNQSNGGNGKTYTRARGVGGGGDGAKQSNGDDDEDGDDERRKPRPSYLPKKSCGQQARKRKRPKKESPEGSRSPSPKPGSVEDMDRVSQGAGPKKLKETVQSTSTAVPVTEQCSTLANEPDESQAELMAAASMPQDVSPDPLFPQCQDVAHTNQPAAVSLDNLCIHSKAETRREEQVEKDRDEDMYGPPVGSGPETFKEGPFKCMPPDVCSGTSSVGPSRWKSTSIACAGILEAGRKPSPKGPPEHEPDIGGTVATGTSGYVSNFSGHSANDQYSASLKDAGQSTSTPACVVVTNFEGMEPVRIQLKPSMSSCSDLVIEIQNLPRYSELSTKWFTLLWQETGEAVRVTDTFGSGEHRLVAVEAPEGGDWLWRM